METTNKPESKNNDILQLMHDSVNPVIRIKSLVKLIKKDKTIEGQEKMLDMIDKSADELNTVLDSFYTNTKFKQLCVWPATVVVEKDAEEDIRKFKAFMASEFNARIKYEAEVKTLPGQGGEGGRNDLFFYIHEDDIKHFAIPRLKVGIRWWEDVLDNGGGVLYKQEILNKYPKTW